MYNLLYYKLLHKRHLLENSKFIYELKKVARIIC